MAQLSKKLLQGPLRVELRRYRHPHWVTTLRTDRWQLFTLWTCRQPDVELSCVGVAIDTSPTQLNSTRRRVELCRYKRALTINTSVHNSWSDYNLITHVHVFTCSTIAFWQCSFIEETNNSNFFRLHRKFVICRSTVSKANFYWRKVFTSNDSN